MQGIRWYLDITTTIAERTKNEVSACTLHHSRTCSMLCFGHKVQGLNSGNPKPNELLKGSVLSCRKLSCNQLSKSAWGSEKWRDGLGETDVYKSLAEGKSISLL